MWRRRRRWTPVLFQLLGCCVGGVASGRFTAPQWRLGYDTDTPQPAPEGGVECRCELAAHIPTKTPRQAPAHRPTARGRRTPRDAHGAERLTLRAGARRRGEPGAKPPRCAMRNAHRIPDTLGAGRSRHRSPTYRTAEAAQPRPHQDKSTKHHSNDEQVPVNLVRREETDCAAWRRATYNTARACGAWAHGPVWTGKLRARVRQDSHKSQV